MQEYHGGYSLETQDRSAMERYSTRFCPSKTAYNRFNRWAKGFVGFFFFELRSEIDTEWVFANGSDVRAHQHAHGTLPSEERVIATKRHLRTDAHGNPVDSKVTGGEVHNAKMTSQWIDLLEKKLASFYDNARMKLLTSHSGFLRQNKRLSRFFIGR